MYTSLTPLNHALEQLLADARVNSREVDLPLREALGCVLANSRSAAIDVPAFDNSAMDGYAVNTADVTDAGCVLPVSQTIAAGHPGTPLVAGSAARIFTGAPIPEGCNAVVIQENTARDEDRVTILQVPVAGDNIRGKGHDIARGSEVLKAGHRLRPQDLGMLASLGIPAVRVKQPMKVAIINTGDEVIPPDQELGPGQIYDSNSFTLEGLLQGMGMTVIRKGIVADTLAGTQAVLQEAAADADCILSTGGVSVGDEDHVRQAVQSLGSLDLWKLAIKPGKPFSYGRVNGKPFFGLPGNPVAVFVTFAMLVRPYLLKVQGASQLALPTLRVRAGFDISEAGSRLEFIRVRLVSDQEGEQELQPFGNQGSSIMTSLSWADGIAEIPLGTTISRGQMLNYFPFNGLL
jgi:molybdopterin molybdotransferase